MGSAVSDAQHFGPMKISDALDAAVVGDDAATVAVDQAADEILRRLIDKLLLPGLKLYRPQVLQAWAMLREQARPVLGRKVDVCAGATRSRPDARSLARHHSIDALATTLDDVGILRIACDPEHPAACGP